MTRALRKGDRVHDEWWPWRTGRVERVGKTRIRVRWEDTGEKSSYDRPHQRFLRLGVAPNDFVAVAERT